MAPTAFTPLVPLSIQLAALYDLFLSLNGDGWHHSDHWSDIPAMIASNGTYGLHTNISADDTLMYYVNDTVYLFGVVIENDTVATVDLSYNNLVGTLPDLLCF
jgi:hypothetical protein